jgi:hypothetical protein
MGEYVRGTWANVVRAAVTVLGVIAGIGSRLATVFPKWLGR